MSKEESRSLWPEDYIDELGETEDPDVTPSSYVYGGSLGSNPVIGSIILTSWRMLFVGAHVFAEMRNMTKQLKRIADVLEHKEKL